MDITDQDYELLSQYLDGELSSEDVELFELRLSTEPALQSSLSELRALHNQLQDTYARAAAGPVPGYITGLLDNATPHIIPLPHKRVASWGFALAASLFVAVAAVQLSQQTLENSPDEAFSIALENTPSRGSGWDSLSDGRQIRTVLTFQNTDGQWCREYLLAESEAHWHGVACRSEGIWSNSVAARVEAADTSAAYRPAGALESDDVATFIDTHAADIPLDARQESEVIARGWR